MNPVLGRARALESTQLMSKGFIFWQQPLRVAGPRTAHAALAKLRELTEARRFALGERLAGTIKDPGSAPRIRVWRKGPLSAAGDIVEFDGTLRAEGKGTVIEGTVEYKLGSKVQFAGILAIGVLIAAMGAMQRLDGAPAEGGLFPFGIMLTAVAALWIFASSRMRVEQVRFIEANLRACVADRAQGENDAA